MSLFILKKLSHLKLRLTSRGSTILLLICCLLFLYAYGIERAKSERVKETLVTMKTTSESLLEFSPIIEEIKIANEVELKKTSISYEKGEVKRSMVVTTWRSGSTFIGDILLAHPAMFYHYEPLLRYGIVQIPEKSTLSSIATKELTDLFHCNYSNKKEYFDFARHHVYALNHNERLWRKCKAHSETYCYNDTFVGAACSLYPFQSMKTVRLRLNSTRAILEDKSLNVQVLYLVRDPRATLQSRKHRTWCPGHPDCDHPENLCSDLVHDYYAAQQLLKHFPGRVKVVRYEDFCLDIYENTKSLLEFFQLTMTDEIKQFLQTHTKKNIGGVSSTFRDSKKAPYHWRNELTFPEVDGIQSKCTAALNLWGYKKANSRSDLTKLDPLLPFHM